MRVQGGIEGSETTRAYLIEKEGTLDYRVGFAVRNRVIISIRQGDKLVKLADDIRITEVSEDGSLCTFEFEIPSEIDLSQPMTVIGVTPILPDYVLVDENNQLMLFYNRSWVKNLDIGWSNSGGPMSFIVKDYKHTDNLLLNVRFNHLGSYVAYHITNNTSEPLKFSCSLLTSERTHPWFDRSLKYVGGWQCYGLNLETRELGIVKSLPGQEMHHNFALPANDTETRIGWSLIDASHATMSGKLILADFNGEEKLSVNTLEVSNFRFEIGKIYHVYLTIKEDGSIWFTDKDGNIPEVAVESIALNPTAVTLMIGGSADLVVKYTPEDATQREVTWESSNEQVATVVNGKVTAIAKGEAVITATTKSGGHKATCTVTVRDAMADDLPGEEL